MKIKSFLVTCSFLICFPVHASAMDELVIRKFVMDWNIARQNFTCLPPIQIEVGRDVSDIRDEKCGSVFVGKLDITLSGPPGTTVTLYGDYNFKKDNGFLILRKNDDQTLWLKDLVDLPVGQFSSEANEDSGAFEAFYKASPIFDRSVYSVQWGDNSLSQTKLN